MDLNRYFSKEDKQMANKDRKKYSTSINHDINVNQNQIICHLIPNRMT